MNKSELLLECQEKIINACKQSGRKPEQIKLIAVSKKKPWTDIAEFLSLGQIAFGENYMQEAHDKIKCVDAWLEKQPLNVKPDWHFIGPLQSNKIKLLLNDFTLLHSLDRISLANKLNTMAMTANLSINALLQVNIDNEKNKAGFMATETLDAIAQLSDLTNINIKGLMCIPAPKSRKADTRASFCSMRELLEQINAKHIYREDLTELSMGMSSDFEEAILEGATYIRVGSALFGERIG